MFIYTCGGETESTTKLPSNLSEATFILYETRNNLYANLVCV